MKNKNLSMTFLFIIGFWSTSLSQPNNSFCLTIGGTGNDDAVGLAKTNDNGSVICGYTNSFGAGLEDCYIVKLDSIGQIEWTKTVGGSNVDKAYSIVQTSDGGYAFTGITQSFGAGGNDVYIVKLDSTGSLIWTKTIGGVGSDYGNAIIETSDGGLAIAGWYGYNSGDYDAYLIKMDALGNVGFSNTYGGSGEDIAYSLFENNDGSYVLSGYTKTYGAGQKDCYILKISNVGILMWTKTIGGSLNEEAYDIIQTADGGFAFAGVTQSYGTGGNDCYLVKLDASGNLSWTKTIGGLNSDYFNAIKEKINGNLLISGWYGINAGNYDLYFTEFSNIGTFLSGKTVGSPGVETGQSMIITNEGCTVIAGYSDNLGSGLTDMYVVKFDSANNVCSGCNSLSSVGTVNTGGGISFGGLDGSAGLLSSGGTVSSGGVLSLICQNLNVGLLEDGKETLFSLYPNPAKSQINIIADAILLGTFYKLYDITGKCILTGNVSAKKLIIDVDNFPAGSYLFCIGKDQKQKFKIIK